MLLPSNRKKCPLCSRLSSGLKEVLRRLFRIGVDCHGINRRTYDEEQRVALINAAAPDCACEKYRMSQHSPGVVENSEQLALFVFLPMHHIGKNGNAKPNIFSHVHLKGRSIQRDTVANPNELVNFARKFLDADDKRAWKGVLLAKCDDVRSIKIVDSLNRSVCVYDTAEKENPAHGEIGQTQYIEEADVAELRHALLTAFGNGAIAPPFQYRNGEVWDELPEHLQARK